MASRKGRFARWSGLLALSGAALVVSGAPLARASNEPSAADRESARAYMTEGRQKRDSGDLKAALRAFEAADAVMHVPTTALEVARTQAMMGLLVEARDLALQIARAPAKPNEPPPFQEARAAAQKLADDLDPRVPSIRIVLKGAPDGVEVKIDDVVLPAVAVGLPRKLNPGSHAVIAKLGTVERKMVVQVLEREAKEVPIEWATPATAATAPPNVVSPPAPTPTPAAPESPSHGPWIGLGIGSLGLAVAGVAAGAITGLMSISETNTVKSQCAGTSCPAVLSDGRDTNSVLSDARTLGAIADVAFIAAGAFAVVGTIFVVVGATHKAKVEIGLGPGSVFFGGKF